MQDSQLGRGSIIIDALAEIAESARYRSLRASVAYATPGGTKSLVDRLRSRMMLWRNTDKQWLISIDFGRTNPESLSILSKLSNSSVRVPDGDYLLNNKLIPSQCFHPKTYIFETHRNRRCGSLGLFTGSANMSLSGLYSGTEHGIMTIWTPPLDRNLKRLFVHAKNAIGWWNDSWGNSTPLSKAFLNQYRVIWNKYAAKLNEDNSHRVNKFARVASGEVDTNEALTWNNAKYFWIQTYELYHNRGALLPGNQVDLRRGSRVFFGFSHEKVPRNTVLGYVMIRYKKESPCRRSIRFANNSMDKINLPIPGDEGPPTYDNSVILFERIDEGEYRIELGTPITIARWKASSEKRSLLYSLSGGREFGLF